MTHAPTALGWFFVLPCSYRVSTRPCAACPALVSGPNGRRSGLVLEQEGQTVSGQPAGVGAYYSRGTRAAVNYNDVTLG